MSKEIKRQKRALVVKPAYVLLAVLSLAYIFLLYRDAVILKPEGGGRAELFIISATIAIPEILIWAIAFLSSMKLKAYASSIRNSKDGVAMSYLADSLVLMSIYIILVCISDNVVTLFKNTTNLHTMVLLGNYLPLAVAFASSFLLIFASIRFNHLIKIKLSRPLIYVSAVLFIVFVGLFIWHCASINHRVLTEGEVPRFVSSVRPLMYTYILPQVILWGMGLFACLGIANYSINVHGSIYKKLLNNLSKGVLIVFVCIFLAQLFILSSFSINKFSLPLVLVYCLLVFGTFGFTLIYKGTSSLSKLERI